MGLKGPEAEEVEGWLAHPPDPDSIDPLDVPQAHRKVFLDEVSSMVMADGVIADSEAENLALFQALIS